VYELGKEEPALYKPLLDGLLWHSNDKLPGRMVRVNYYVRDIYGDPVDFWDPWHSPLAHFTAFADNDTYMHPAIAKVIQLKWEAFGLKMFLAKEKALYQTMNMMKMQNTTFIGYFWAPADQETEVMNKIAIFPTVRMVRYDNHTIPRPTYIKTNEATATF
jgi:hypothetical protein